VGCGIGSFDVGGGVKKNTVVIDVEGFDVKGCDVVGFSVGFMVALFLGDIVGCDVTSSNIGITVGLLVCDGSAVSSK
jgi:hypothetical protein